MSDGVTAIVELMTVRERTVAADITVRRPRLLGDPTIAIPPLEPLLDLDVVYTAAPVGIHPALGLLITVCANPIRLVVGADGRRGRHDFRIDGPGQGRGRRCTDRSGHHGHNNHEKDRTDPRHELLPQSKFRLVKCTSVRLVFNKLSP